jgi:hypothetical protein
VLKPQLEGGAGNYYGEEIPRRLKSYSLRERATHILMQRIRPLVVKVCAIIIQLYLIFLTLELSRPSIS